MVDVQELVKGIFNDFLLTFFCIMMVVSIVFRVLGLGGFGVDDVFAIAVLSTLCASCHRLVFHSKKELNKLELLLRHFISFVLAAVLVVVFDMYMGWGFGDSTLGMLILIGMILAVYVISVAIEYYQTAKTTDELAKKIKELNADN